MWHLALWPVSDVCHTVMCWVSVPKTRYPVWEQRWQIARAHLTTGADLGIQPLCQAEKHSPIITGTMKEDKCFCSRLQVDRVSMLVPLLIWITGTLQGCIVLQVVKLRKQLFSHSRLLPNRMKLNTSILNSSGFFTGSRHWLPVNLFWLNESCIRTIVYLGYMYSAIRSH